MPEWRRLESVSSKLRAHGVDETMIRQMPFSTWVLQGAGQSQNAATVLLFQVIELLSLLLCRTRFTSTDEKVMRRFSIDQYSVVLILNKLM